MKRRIISCLLALTMITVSTVTVTATTTSFSPKNSIELSTVITEQPFITDNIVGTLKVMENDVFTRVILYDNAREIVVYVFQQ